LFWGLNLGVVRVKDVKHEESETVDFINEADKPVVKGSSGIFDKLGQLVKKAIDCCKE